MPMLSYAQNREDVLLARALPGPAGFYIDVGAAHPVSHSVTKWFYDLGWSGVNLEPLPHFFDLIVRDRPRDVNLNAVASDAPGTLTLFEVPHSIGMSTVDPALAGEMTRGGAALIPHAVPARTLRDVCAEHVGDRAIDFLKVDAEGHEHAVLAGADFTRWRPRVLVIGTINFMSWGQFVIDSGYTFALFDGLNRYYVRNEEPDLIPRLAVPVNCLDDFIPHEYADRIERLEQEVATARAVAAREPAATQVLAHNPARTANSPGYTNGHLPNQSTIAPEPVKPSSPPFYTNGCRPSHWSRWPAVVARRCIRRIQRPFFFALQATLDDVGGNLASQHAAITDVIGRLENYSAAADREAAVHSQLQAEMVAAREREAALVARVDALAAAHSQLQAEAVAAREREAILDSRVGVQINSACLDPNGVAAILDDMEWRGRELRAAQAADRPVRILFAISSGSQLYSGVGRALFEFTKRSKGQIDYEFAIDDGNPRNVEILVRFGRDNGLPVHVGQAGDTAGDRGNRSLPELLRGGRWDAVECVTFANSATHRLLLDHAGDTRIVYTPHYQPMWTIPVTPDQSRQIETVHGELLRRAALITCDSPWEWLALRQAAAPGVDCAFLPLGFDPTAFTTGPRERRPYLLFVGDQVETRKRFQLTLEVFAEVLLQCPNVRLVIVGNKSDQLAQALPVAIRSHCVPMGYVSEDELRSLYRDASGLLLLSDYEAFGLPILESLACGTPVFLTRRPTVAGLFGRYKGTVFVDDDTPRRMAAPIVAALARGGDFIEQVVTDRPRLEADLSWDRLAAKRCQAIRAAIGARLATT